MGRINNCRCKDEEKVYQYVGRGFNPDKYVFHALMVLALTFLALYILLTSLPGWYVLQEQTATLSTCSTADHILTTHVRRKWTERNTPVFVSSSLWYLRIVVGQEERTFERFLPFLFLNKDPVERYIQNGLLVESVLPKNLTTILLFVFLCMGVVFTCCASDRPSRLVYYGLSNIMLVASITCWITIANTLGEQFLLSVAADLCVEQGVVKTSFLLQTLTASAGILSFVFGSVLMHVGIMINEKVKVDRSVTQRAEEFDVAEKVEQLYATKSTEVSCKLSHHSIGAYVV